MPHSIIHGDACFAYFNKIWGIPDQQNGPVLEATGILERKEMSVSHVDH